MLDFWQIQFPIFQLKKTHSLQTVDNCLVVETFEGEYLVIDNKNMPGDSLGMRRIQHQFHNELNPFGRALFKLTKPINNIVDMLHAEVDRFIDSSGRVFNYRKNKFYRLECFKIKKFVETDGGYVVRLHGIYCGFYLNRAPHVDELFARVLRVGKGYILYELTNTYVKPSRLKL